MEPTHEAYLVSLQRDQAARRVRALIKLEAAMEAAHQARAEIYNNMPAGHPAQGWLRDVKRAIYMDMEGVTSMDGTLFTLAANLELISRLE